MNVLLTGNDGYLGAVMAPALAARGHVVKGLDAGFYRDGLLYSDSESIVPGLTMDTRHVTVDEFRGFDAIIHLGELSDAALCQRYPDQTFAINGEGSERVA